MKSGRRWTLGGLMLVVALSSLPMAWYVHHAREAGRQQSAADARRAAILARIEELLAERKNQR